MTNKLLHTPDGVRDIYEEECARKLTVQEKIQKVLHLYGYRSIETPAFEFFDIFAQERGSVSSKEMYKFFDRDNNTLVLRPDMTPAIARCVAKYYMDEVMPIRLCYLGHTYINHSSYRGRLKESTQTGVELIGEDSSSSDAEMIAMVIDSLKASGLLEFQVEIGQVEFFRGLVEEAGMDAETEEQLRVLIENKNHFGVEELLDTQQISAQLKEVFLKLPELFGTIDQITAARALTTNVRALHAIDRLEKIQVILETYGLADYISYDLGMLSEFQYYTGIIFKAYTYGTGDYIVNGGRYDGLLEQFGKAAPSVGFGIEVDQLMLALSRQKVDVAIDMVNTIVLFESTAQTPAIKLASHFRSQNMAVQLVRKSSHKSLSDYMNFAKRSRIRNVLYLEADNGTVKVIEVATGNTDEIPLTAYVKEV